MPKSSFYLYWFTCLSCLTISHFLVYSHSYVSSHLSIWALFRSGWHDYCVVYSLILTLKKNSFFLGLVKTCNDSRHFIQYSPYAKQDEINLSCIKTEDDRVIKFLIALTLHGQLFVSPLTVLPLAKNIFNVHYRDLLLLVMLSLSLTLEIIMSIRWWHCTECCRITEQLRLEEITEDLLVQFIAQSRARHSRLLRSLSSLVLDISHSTNSLGNLFQHLTTLTHNFSSYI